MENKNYLFLEENPYTSNFNEMKSNFLMNLNLDQNPYDRYRISYREWANYEKKWKIIYTDVENYFENENNISNILKSGEFKAFFQGYLVDKDWVDKWKSISCYDNIKTKFLENHAKDELEIKRLIINVQKRSLINYDNLKESIENYIITNEKQLSEFASTNKLFVILNNKFLSTFINNLTIKTIEFILSNKTISIRLNNRKELKFITDNNIIGKSKKFQYYSYNLKHLLRFLFFKYELKSASYSSQKGLRSAYLINNQIIKRFEEIYALKKLFDELIEGKLLNGINYKNCNENFIRINEFLNEHKIEYINNIQQQEQPGNIKLKGRDIVFTSKYINNQPNLIYIDNFEIIDKEFYTFLRQKFGDDLFMYQTFYYNLDNKIFLIINYDQTYIYEIISFNPEKGDIIVEYLIEVLVPIRDKSFSYDINTLNNSIFKYIVNNELPQMISKVSPITIERNISLKFHRINNFLGQSFNDDEIIAVNFRTSDQLINYPIGGKSSDNFSILEEKLYIAYPQLRNKKIYFIANGNILNRMLSLEQNNIKSGTTILIKNIY